MKRIYIAMSGILHCIRAKISSLPGVTNFINTHIATTDIPPFRIANPSYCMKVFKKVKYA
jgi:hypothetical protein